MSRSHWLCRVSIASIASIALTCFAACGGGDDDDDDDDVSLVDSGNNADCPAAASLGSFEPSAGAQALHFTQPPPNGQPEDPSLRFLSVVADVSGGEDPPDLLVVQLWDGFGAFEGGQIAEGDYTIAGAEATVNGCGICLFMFGDAQLVGGELVFAKQYIATAGSVSIVDIGDRANNDITGNYTGSISGLTMTEVDENSQDGSALNGGCQSSLDEIAWDAPIANGDEAGG
jgi:hypothetical protein